MMDGHLDPVGPPVQPEVDPAPPARRIVLDTNIVLDLYLFADQAVASVRAGLADGRLHWIATAVMREELRHVLAYAHIQSRLAYYQRSADEVLAAFDAQSEQVPVPPKVPVTCKDPDDQKFVDLAAAHQSLLLSKDRAVLRLRKRLVPWGVWTGSVWDPLAALV